MSYPEGEDRVLATLPNGARVLSTMITDQLPPRHVYRVVSSTGTVQQEFFTLIELNSFVRSTPPGLGLTRVIDEVANLFRVP